MRKKIYYLKLILSLIFIFFCLSYLFVPLYELLCTQLGWGVVTNNDFAYWLNTNKKLLKRPDEMTDFFFKDNFYLKELLRSNLKYRQNIHFDSTFSSFLIPIFFKTNIHGNLPLSFYLNEDLIQVRLNNSQLIIFNIYNFSNDDIDFFIGYQIFPYYFTKFIVKLQCFCYEHILIQGYSFLKLPVLFYISSEILDFSSSYFDNDFSCIFFYYHIFKSNNVLKFFS